VIDDVGNGGLESRRIPAREERKRRGEE